MEPVGVFGAGGIEKSSAGAESSPSTAPANQPMPRAANTCQIFFWFLPLLTTRSAARIELRSSRKDGLDGDSSIARVTRDSVVLLPSALRRSHRVSPQISPSACTSTPREEIRP